MVTQFFYRVAIHEAKTVRDCRHDAFDAAIIKASYIAPHEAGKRSEPVELRDALMSCGAPWLVDLCTPQLGEAEVLLDPGFSRLRESALGRVLPLPLDASRLENEEARDAFVEACAAFQAGAPIISAPYLELRADDDPRLEANLAMLRRIVGAAGDRLAVGFLQINLDGLNRGVAVRAARRYAETGVRLLFLRVRSFKAEEATEKHVLAYQAAVEAFAGCGIDVVADQVGRFGAVAVGLGAVGFSGGTQFFRSVPRKLVSTGGGGGGEKLPVEMPHQWRALPRDRAPQQFECPLADCAVAAGDRSLEAIREHDLHYQRYLAGLAADLPALIDDLRRSGRAEAAIWATVLARRLRRSA
jgi:hypothetical protein